MHSDRPSPLIRVAGAAASVLTSWLLFLFVVSLSEPAPDGGAVRMAKATPLAAAPR
jgi:hypothetical protein